MTDNEIIKALERCITPVPLRCNKCAYLGNYFSCRSTDLKKDVLDLINRQKAEIERLQKEIEVKDNIYQRNTGLRKKRIFDLIDELKKAKSEAIKEFVERFEKEIETTPNVNAHFRFALLKYAKQIKDNLVKEMTEVETNQRKEDGKNV